MSFLSKHGGRLRVVLCCIDEYGRMADFRRHCLISFSNTRHIPRNVPIDHQRVDLAKSSSCLPTMHAATAERPYEAAAVQGLPPPMSWRTAKLMNTTRRPTARSVTLRAPTSPPISRQCTRGPEVSCCQDHNKPLKTMVSEAISSRLPRVLPGR